MVQQTLLPDELIAHVRALVAGHDARRTAHDLQALVDRSSAHAVMAALDALPDTDLISILNQLPDRLVADLVVEREPQDGARLLLRLASARAADVLDAMAPDDATDLLGAIEELDPRAGQALLGAMQPAEAGDVRRLLAYPEDSAGGIMTTEVTVVPPELTAEQALAVVRRFARAPQTETVYYLYVTDPDGRLLGVLSLRELVLAAPRVAVQEVMRRSFTAVRPTTDQEQAARLLTERHLLALPVVDDDGRLLGIVTIDDVATVLEQEATEDIHRLGGVYEEEDALSPVGRSLRTRVPWLLLNLLTAFLAAAIVAPFEGTIERVAALAVFMPVIAGHGGNTGTQVATIVVRSLSLGTMQLSDMWKVVRKEIVFGLVHGLLAGLLAAAYALVLSGNLWLALVVVVAMVGNVLVAGIVGSLIPLGLRRAGQDPALASSIWLTTFTDMFGFFALLGTGTLLVSKLS